MSRRIRFTLHGNRLRGPFLRLVGERGCVLITCNRDDFLAAAGRVAHHGIVIFIRRKSRARERAALVRLLDTAGESGLRGNINFA